jgi:CheY-like chemotaxis protein
MQGPSRLRLMIADDDPVIRVVLEQGLGERFEIVGTAADTPDAISLAAATRPDVALVDVDMASSAARRPPRSSFYPAMSPSPRFANSSSPEPSPTVARASS